VKVGVKVAVKVGVGGMGVKVCVGVGEIGVGVSDGAAVGSTSCVAVGNSGIWAVVGVCSPVAGIAFCAAWVRADSIVAVISIVGVGGRPPKALQPEIREITSTASISRNLISILLVFSFVGHRPLVRSKVVDMSRLN
jgi:hypothetical protein